MGYIVQLQIDTYLAPWSGDPGRTLKRSNAKIYKSEHLANVALSKARKYRPFENAKIIEVR